MSDRPTFEQALNGLTGKQRAFVLAYLDCLNASEAARRAGYAVRSLRQVASENLAKPDIKEALRLGFERKIMPKEEVIARLSATATASLEDFITLEAAPEGDEAPATPHPGHWRLDLAKAKRRGVLGALKKLKWGEHGPEIELYSALEALQLLGKYHRAFVERQEVSGPEGGAIPVAFYDYNATAAEITDGSE